MMNSCHGVAPQKAALRIMGSEKGVGGGVPLAGRFGNLPQGRHGVASWQPAARVATQCPPHR